LGFLMEYTLTDSEQLIARFVAKQRSGNNRNAGTVNMRKSEMSDFEIDLQGFGGELAFCRLANVFPDLTVHNRSASKGEDQGDCILNGQRIDVKTSKKAEAALWVPVRKIGTADAYALMTGKFPTFRLVGMADVETVKNEKVWNDSHVVNQDKLIDIAVWQFDLWAKG